MKNLMTLVQQNKNQILLISNRYGIKNIRLFGSIVRGEENENSDIDFLVELEMGRSFLDLVGYWQDLEEILNCSVDVVSENGLSPYLKEKILKEAIKL